MRRICAILLGVMLAVPASADDRTALFGTHWLTDKGKARVMFQPCPANSSQLCGRITWLAKPLDAAGKPLTDLNNPDPREKTRPILNMMMIEGFRWREDDETWRGGTIYDPQDGQRYPATISLEDRTTLKVSGCVLFLCSTQRWTDPRKGR